MGWIEDLQNFQNSVNQTPVMKGIKGAFNFLDTAPNRPDKLNAKPGQPFTGNFNVPWAGKSTLPESFFPQTGNRNNSPFRPANEANGSYGQGQGVLKAPARGNQSFGQFMQDSGMGVIGQGDLSGGEAPMSAREKAYLEAIDAIRRKTEEQYSYDGANDSLVDQAFQGSLDAINNARNSTNENYGQSKQMLDQLTNSHVANIQGADRNAINQIGDQLTGDYTAAYDKRNTELSADRNAEMAAKVEMLQRLGIQDTGLDGAGDTQTAAIADNASERKGAMQQASGYKAADLTRNTEMGQNMAAAGVERQSDLRKQLDGILSNLDNSEAGVRNSIASAKLEGRQADRASWDDQQKYNNETLIKMQQGETDQANVDADRAFQREMAGLKAGGSSAKGTASAFDLANDRIRQTGYDPAAYESAYANAMAKGGGALGGSGGDKASYLIQQMTRENPQLDPREVNRYVSAILGYGTDKLNAAAQY